MRAYLRDAELFSGKDSVGTVVNGMTREDQHPLMINHDITAFKKKMKVMHQSCVRAWASLCVFVCIAYHHFSVSTCSGSIPRPSSLDVSLAANSSVMVGGPHR